MMASGMSSASQAQSMSLNAEWVCLKLCLRLGKEAERADPLLTHKFRRVGFSLPAIPPWVASKRHTQMRSELNENREHSSSIESQC